MTTDHVTRRRVFYIPGYDPSPPRRYRELYRREGAIQAGISGYEIMQQACDGGWQVDAVMDGHHVQTRFEVLVWSDLVQDSMGGSVLATYGQMLRTAWIYARSGALLRLMRLRKGPVIAALYPVVMLLAQLLLALLTGWGVVAVLGPWGSVAGIGVAWAMLRAFRAYDNRLLAYYLMHDFAHTAQANGAYPPDLQTRLCSFANRIRAALDSDVDEVLVVGHSTGAHLAVSALADVLRSGVRGPALSLLSLGQVVPMVSFLPEAQQLRADLNELSQSDQITWVDITAPGDGCAFALCDPVRVSGGSADTRWPLVLSAAFSQTLSPERWAALRWRFHWLHFQYLGAFDRPDHYDYFRITAGPMTLGARYAGQAPSKSCITAPISGHTSRAA